MKRKVIIVEPSSEYGEILKSVLLESGYDVLELLSNGSELVDMIEQNIVPDFVITELEMPEMDGFKLLHYLKNYNEQSDVTIYPVVVTTKEEHRRDAFRLKARQFVIKCSELQEAEVYFKRRLVPLLDMVQIETKVKQSYSVSTSKKTIRSNFKAIAIGVSTGGPKAISSILPKISKNHPDIPIFIVQHMPVNFTQRFAENLNKQCTHNVIEVTEPLNVENGMIYIAKGGIHMVIKEGSPPVITIEDTAPENNCKPSVDVFLRGFAKAYQDSGLTIILTGMGNDGAKALTDIKKYDGTIFVQDEESSVVWGMPGSAVKTGHVDKVISLDIIPEEIYKALHRKL